MQTKPSTINHQDLVIRKDGLAYKKHARKTFTGSTAFYYEKGDLGMLGNLKNGQWHGLFEWFHKNGKLMNSATFMNGKYIATELNDGDQKLLCIHEDDIEIKKGVSYGAGKKLNGAYKVEHRSGNYVESLFKRGIEAGPYLYFDDSGDLWIRTKKCGNNYHGAYLSTFAIDDVSNKMALSDVCEYYKGEAHGPEFWFYENGIIQSCGHYNKGKHHGLFQRFYDNGQLKRIINYKNDLPDGEDKSFHRNGQLWLNWFWKYLELADGSVSLEDGTWETFNEKGELTKTIIWYEDRFETKIYDEKYSKNSYQAYEERARYIRTINDASR
jgi:antitoxin component YwqK of YwqJK toxin-antitoxin module